MHPTCTFPLFWKEMSHPHTSHERLKRVPFSRRALHRPRRTSSHDQKRTSSSLTGSLGGYLVLLSRVSPPAPVTLRRRGEKSIFSKEGELESPPIQTPPPGTASSNPRAVPAAVRQWQGWELARAGGTEGRQARRRAGDSPESAHGLRGAVSSVQCQRFPNENCLHCYWA